MKKAQIQGQIFIYILTVIIAGFIFAFGYNAVVGFTQQIQTSKLIDFEVDLKDTVIKISSEFQSLEKHKFNLPGEFTKVCFINFHDTSTFYPPNSDVNPKYTWIVEAESDVFQQNYPLLYDAIDSGVKDNVYIYSNWLEKSFSIGEITLKNELGANVPYECIELNNGNLFIEVRGLGNKAEIKYDKPDLN